jgi:uncharacterized membrane protein YqjE
MESEDDVEPSGALPLHEAAANVGARAIGLVGTRLELAGVELAEARVRLVQSLLLVGAALGFALLALIVVTFGIVAWFWDDGRFVAIAILAVLYAGAAGVLWLRFRTLGRTAPALFDATVTALRADSAALRGKIAEISS